jgi:hypothetical protein
MRPLAADTEQALNPDPNKSFGSVSTTPTTIFVPRWSFAGRAVHDGIAADRQGRPRERIAAT